MKLLKKSLSYYQALTSEGYTKQRPRSLQNWKKGRKYPALQPVDKEQEERERKQRKKQQVSDHKSYCYNQFVRIIFVGGQQFFCKLKGFAFQEGSRQVDRTDRFGL